MMENVTVLKSELIAKVLKNRKDHIAEFIETMDGYRDALIEKLQALHYRASNQQEIDFSDLFKMAQKPQSHEKEYDRALAMLEMSTDTHVTLTEHDFGQLVMDEWDWKQAFALSGSLYKGK